MSPRPSQRMQVICILLPRDMVKMLDQLVAEKKYKNRSEAIREAIRLLLLYHTDMGKLYIKMRKYAMIC